MNEKNLGILLRVSSDIQQSDGGGLEVQKRMGMEMCKSLGLVPIIFDEGSQSSFQVELEERIVLVELLDEIEKGKIKNVWVFNSDRLGRSTQSWWSIYKVFLDNGVKVYIGSSTKPYDLDNPIDEFQMGILSIVSQYDNKLRRMRSVMGKRNSLKSGNTFVGGTIPFGYNVKGKKLVPNVNEVKVLKNVFEMYRDGMSTVQIKLYLDTKTEFKPKRSSDGWNIGTIQKMLGNTLYKGVQKWEWKELVSGKSKIVETILLDTPRVIPIKLWEDVQIKLNENHKNRNTEKSQDSLLNGLIFCKSCGVKLSSSSKGTNPLYSCRSVEYKWKNPNKWGSKHHNCSLKRSLRITETDNEILNHIISIVKESKRIRENYKVKNLNPKFDEIDNIKKETDRKTKYLNEKRKIQKGYEENIIGIEVDILTNTMDREKGKKMVSKISDMMEVVSSDIKKLERELWLYDNSTQWIDWLNQMYLGIENVLTYSLEDKKKFLNEYINKIEVEYLPDIQSHKLFFEFKYPIVEDKLIINGNKKDGTRDYKIEGGNKISTQLIPIKNNYKSKLSLDKKEELNKMITFLRVEQSLSLNKVSLELNNKGYRTSTNKEWNKSNLSLYIKRLSFDEGK